MDNGIFSILSLSAIFLPLIYALYLFFSRLSLSFVNKKILNYGCCAFNLISLVIFFLTDYFALNRTQIAKFDFNFFAVEKFSLDFGIFIDDANITYLIFASLICFILSVYSKIYFDKKKQFIFTKQRYYIFLSTISFLIYFFIASENLFQGTIALFAQSVALLTFAYFDIFKNPTNHNITRFHRISLIGNFALLIASLILFKYAILSKGYVESNSLNYNELNVLSSYMYGICSANEFKLTLFCFILAVMSRLTIFPLNCYYSFFVNSSNIMYLTCISLVNNIIGVFLFLKILPIFELIKNCIIPFEIFLGFGILISLIQIIFERNLKIIFGYLFSAINSLFVILFLNYDILFIQNLYFALNLVFIILLMILFYKDKINLPKRLVNKQIGFFIEKGHIIFFEIIPDKLSKVIDIIDEKIIKNFTPLLIKIFNFIISFLVLKTMKNNYLANIRNILILFAIFVLFAIFIALFGGV